MKFAFIADINVLHRIIKSMAGMQDGGNIWRGDNDNKGLFILIGLCGKV